jgi:hypothetical protein
VTELPPLVRAYVDGLIAEAKEAGLEVRLLDGVVPYIPSDAIPSLEDKKRALDFVASSPRVGGGRIFREGIVLEPAKERISPPSWPETEPEVMRRYGLDR